MQRYGRSIIGKSIRSNEALTDSQIMSVAPSVYAQEQHESRSNRYVYIPTIEILNLLRKEGFLPFFATQSRSRIEGKEAYTKHMLRLRPKGGLTNKSEVGEIILINSHDGTSSYKMMSGIFRFICSNGLYDGDITNDYNIHHKGDIKQEILEGAYNITDNFKNQLTEVEKMKAIELQPVEKEIFAESALMLKYPEHDSSPIESNQLLTNRRYEDKKPDLWTTFNKVQENIIKGGLRGKTKTGKNTRTRKVNSIDNDVKLNRALWVLSEKMAELKSGIIKEPQNELIAQ